MRRGRLTFRNPPGLPGLFTPEKRVIFGSRTVSHEALVISREVKMENVKKSQAITCLEKAPWLENAGTKKGLHHDRQHLGVVLSGGQTIKVRQINPAFKSKLMLRLYNDDRNTENSVEFGSAEMSLTAKASAAAFIDTPYVAGKELDIHPEVEFSYPDTAKPLPVYRKGDDEKQFFSDWDKWKSEFALLESDYAIILVPQKDKENLRVLKGGKKTDDLFDHYEDIFTFYNDLAGLSFSPLKETNKNIANRYFFKADKHSPGGASYGYYSVNEHGDSVSGFWLSMDPAGWGKLHEIGHSYEIDYIKNEIISFVEVWNNIFAACYQNERLGADKHKKGWLYDNGQQEAVEKRISGFFNSKEPVHKWGLREKLYFLMLMVFKSGKQAFAEFYQQYRSDRYIKSYYPFERQEVLDMMTGAFTGNGNNVDVTAFIQLAGGALSDYQRELNHFSGARVVYPANQFVQGDLLKKLRNDLALDGDLSLVTVKELQSTGLTGDVYLDLKTPWDFDHQLKNKDLLIMDGSSCVRKVTLTRTGITTVSKLPIGAYSLRVPTGRSEKRQAKLDYLIVKPGSNRIDFPIWNLWHSRIGSQRVKLLGLSDSLFATVTVNAETTKIEVDVLSTQPHSGYGNREYARVVVTDSAGKEMLRKSIPGTGAVVGHDELHFSYSDTLEIYHAESGHRIQLEPEFDGILNQKVSTNTFITTQAGLKNTALKNDPFDFLEWAIDACAAKLRQHANELKSDYAPVKAQIWLAIKVFPDARRNELLKKYKDCIPSDNG
jgi:hypothetical protein